MALEGNYEKLYEGIKEKHPEWSRQRIKEEVDKYGDLIQPKFPEEQMIRLFNHMLYEQGKPLIVPDENVDWQFEDVPGKCKDGIYLPGYKLQFDIDERNKRKERSAAVRRVQSDFMEYMSNGRTEALTAINQTDEKFDRDLKPMIRGYQLTDTEKEKRRIDEYNKKVMDLFGTGEKRKEELIGQGYGEEDAKQVIRAERAKMVMDYIRKNVDGMDHLEDLFDSNLTDNKIAENAKKLLNYNYVVAECKAILNKVPELFTLAPEDEKFLKKLEEKQSDTWNLICKMRAIANPLYEYLDPDLLGSIEIDFWDYGPNDKFPEFQNPWEKDKNVFAGDGADPFEKFEGNYRTLRLQDPVQMFIEDVRSVRENNEMNHMRRTLEAYGFTERDTHYEETKLNSEENEGFTLRKADKTEGQSASVYAIERGERALVFQKQIDDSIELVSPENLYNTMLPEKIHALEDMMREADPTFHMSSTNFRRMRRAFDAVRNANVLLDANEKLEDKRERLKELADACATYINGKQSALDEVARKQEKANANEEEYELSRQETWDRRRTNMAKSLKSFAETKLQELVLIEKARKATKEYEGKSEEKCRILTAQTEKKRLQDEQKQAPAQWIKNKINETYTGANAEKFRIPKSISEPLANLANEMSQEKLTEILKNSPDTFFTMVGRMVAAEQIINEDVQRGFMPGGPLRKLYTDSKNATDETFKKLGSHALSNFLNKKPEELDVEDIQKMVKAFDPKKMADRMPDAEKKDRMVLQGIEKFKDLQRLYEAMHQIGDLPNELLALEAKGAPASFSDIRVNLETLKSDGKFVAWPTSTDEVERSNQITALKNIRKKALLYEHEDKKSAQRVKMIQKAGKFADKVLHMIEEYNRKLTDLRQWLDDYNLNKKKNSMYKEAKNQLKNEQKKLKNELENKRPRSNTLPGSKKMNFAEVKEEAEQKTEKKIVRKKTISFNQKENKKDGLEWD